MPVISNEQSLERNRILKDYWEYLKTQNKDKEPWLDLDEYYLCSAAKKLKQGHVDLIRRKKEEAKEFGESFNSQSMGDVGALEVLYALGQWLNREHPDYTGERVDRIKHLSQMKT